MDNEPIMVKDGYVLMKRTSDGHLFIANPPDKSELKSFYSEEYFAGLKKGYRHNVFLNSEMHLRKAGRKLKRVLNHTSKGKLLDVGCGPGYFLKEASAHFEATGCDLSSDVVRFGRDSLGVKIWEGDFLEFNPEVHYDILTMFSFLEHTLKPEENIAKARELLKENGLMFISIPNIQSLGRYLKGRDWRGFSFPEHLNLFSRRSLSALLEKECFSVFNQNFSECNPFMDTIYFVAQKK